MSSTSHFKWKMLIVNECETSEIAFGGFPWNVKIRNVGRVVDRHGRCEPPYQVKEGKREQGRANHQIPLRLQLIRRKLNNLRRLWLFTPYTHSDLNGKLITRLLFISRRNILVINVNSYQACCWVLNVITKLWIFEKGENSHTAYRCELNL